MQYKDYYKILGVAKNASEEDIRKAFKKLAVLYHPDANQGNSSAEEMFKQINEAKEILTNPEHRFRYDQLGVRFNQFRAARQQTQHTHGSTTTQVQPDEGDLNNVFGRFFDDVFGGGNSKRGKDQDANVKITLEEAYNGMSDVLGFEGKKLRVHIPPGIPNRQVLRLKGQGKPGRKGQEPGDLYMTVIIKPHKTFSRKDNDLYTTINVSLYDAVLGRKVPIQSMKGRMYMTIPKGTQPGEVLKLRDLGMPHYGNTGMFGDLYVTVNIVIPKNLSLAEVKLFEQLAEYRKR